MVIVEISENPNCAAVDLRIFNEVAPPQRARQVRLERETGQPVWYDVTGWTVDGNTAAAYAQKVEDSGEGVAWLIHGANAGVRLRPSGKSGEWNLKAAEQWGEPFLIIGEAADLKLE